MKNLYGTIKNDFFNIVVTAIIILISFLWRDLVTDFKDKYLPVESKFWQLSLSTTCITIILVFCILVIRQTFKLEAADIVLQ